MSEAEPREYYFKPTPNGAEQVWTIRQGQLLRRGANKAIKLADIGALKWQEVVYRGTHSSALDIALAGDEVRIACDAVGASRRDYTALLQALTACLIDAKADIVVEVDTGGAWRRALFILSLLGVALGLFLIANAVFSSAGFGVTLPLLIGNVVTGIATYIALTNRPKLSIEHISLSEFAARLGGRNGGSVVPPEHNSDQA